MAVKQSKGDSKKLTAFQKELLEVVKKINGFREICEVNIVAIIYKKPELLFESTFELDDFSINCWRVYYEIARGIVIGEKKETLDDMTISLYLEKHEKLRGVYEEHGGYDTIDKVSAYAKVENYDGYCRDLRKWICVTNIAKLGFPVKQQLSEFADMDAEDIYKAYEALLNHNFANVDSRIQSYNACDNIYQLIDELDQGKNVGMQLDRCDILNDEIGGFNLNGKIYGICASSGVGKSTMLMNYIVPAVIEHDEKCVFIINEEDQTKLQTELIIWCANNILNKKLQKYQLRNGHFTQETKDILKECADWIEQKKENQNITIVPLEKYSAKTAIHIIRKYASMGVRCFVLDTLKESYDSRNVDTWKSMERDMVDLYNTVKPTALNVGLFVSVQLNKASVKMRHLTVNEIGQSKSIIDVMDCVLMCRRPFEDELDGGNNVIYYERTDINKDGKNRTIKSSLKRSDHAMLTFIAKNRFGQTDTHTIVSRWDMSTNVHEDIGTCVIAQDW